MYVHTGPGDDRGGVAADAGLGGQLGQLEGGQVHRPADCRDGEPVHVPLQEAQQIQQRTQGDSRDDLVAFSDDHFYLV